MTEIFTAILLAGERGGDALAEVAPGKRKGLLPLAGRPMILYGLETLAACAGVGEILVVANDVSDLRDAAQVKAWLMLTGLAARVRFLDGAADPATAVLKTCKENTIDGPLLVAMADAPLLSPATVERFCATALAADADVVIGVVRERDVRKAFPHFGRKALRMADGGVIGANLFAARPGTAQAAARGWLAMEEKRQHPWAFIAHFGFATLVRALFGLLSLKGAVAAVSRTMQMTADAVILDDPMAALTVDRLTHAAMAEALLTGRRL